MFVVEYTVAHQFCLECHRQEAKDTWNAVVQVRQKTAHKKTFFHLEQLMIKHNAHTKTIKISSKPGGARRGVLVDCDDTFKFLSKKTDGTFSSPPRLMPSGWWIFC